jgi:transposase
MIKSIFPGKNQGLVELFESAGQPSKVACVVFDYAKRTHTALICDGAGRRLKGAFPVPNSPEGIDTVVERVEKICRKHQIERRHVFCGGESCGSYAVNFVHGVEQVGFLVVSVNPAEAKKQRENLQASTDKVDLLGIAKLLLDQRGSTRSTAGQIERQLRILTRHRGDLVASRTAMSNRIHGLVDQLVPGFLEERSSGIPPFSETSLWLMEERFSPKQILRRNLSAMVEQARKRRLRQPEAALGKLKAHAASVLEPIPEWVEGLQTALQGEVQMYRSLQRCIAEADRQMALLLARIPAAMLTTIPGIGITLAAAAGAEIGPPQTQRSLRRLSSYSGIVPRVKQSGGPEGASRHGTVSRRCNHLLKNAVVQMANHMGQHGPAELREDHSRRKARGQHADFAIARRILRIGMHIMRSGESYLPASLRRHPQREELVAYYLKGWTRLRENWKAAGALEVAFDTANPLGQWRECIQELYQIDLPL